MPFVDHVFLKSNVGLTAVQDNADPFDGSGGLRIDNTGFELSTPRNIVQEYLGPAFVKGELTGIIRTKINITNHPYSSSPATGGVNEAEGGIYIMASQLDLTGLLGAAYAFVLHVGTSWDWRLVEYSTGIDLVGQTIHDQGDTTGDPDLGKSFVMQMDWRYDLENIGGIRITCRVAEGQDFSKLQTIYSRTISPGLSTSVAEGLCYADLEGQVGGGLVTRMWFQDTFYSNFSARVLT